MGDDRGVTAPTVDAVPRPPKAEPLASGTTIGRFSLLGVLGEGGMGVVYSAYDPELDRRVAIKLLTGRGSSRERDMRLHREAQAMARLSHPNVVAVYDVGAYENHVFVAMELVQGRTLREWIEADKPDWRPIVDAAVQ